MGLFAKVVNSWDLLAIVTRTCDRICEYAISLYIRLFEANMSYVVCKKRLYFFYAMRLRNHLITEHVIGILCFHGSNFFYQTCIYMKLNMTGFLKMYFLAIYFSLSLTHLSKCSRVPILKHCLNSQEQYPIVGKGLYAIQKSKFNKNLYCRTIIS